MYFNGAGGSEAKLRKAKRSKEKRNKARKSKKGQVPEYLVVTFLPLLGEGCPKDRKGAFLNAGKMCLIYLPE